MIFYRLVKPEAERPVLMQEEDFVFCGDAREYCSEIKPLGEFIAFKPGRGGMRLREAPAGHATIVVFAGVWQERPADQASQTKGVRRVSGKRSKKSDSTLERANKRPLPPSASISGYGSVRFF
jgi:hypothetical protein